jgi:hypothetical protein
MAGYNSLTLSTEDKGRQLVLATNTFDMRADLAPEPPVPLVNPMPLMGYAFC